MAALADFSGSIRHPPGNLGAAGALCLSDTVNTTVNQALRAGIRTGCHAL